MTTLDIDDGIYKSWVKFYNKHSKVDYPTLKNFTARKLKEEIEKEGGKNGNNTGPFNR